MSKLSDWVEAHKDNPDDELNVRNYELNAEMYERQYAEAVESGQTHDCVQCGYPQVHGSYDCDNQLIEHKLCFNCWYWLVQLGLQHGPRPSAVIVKGVHYTDGGNQSNPQNKSWLGFGGSKWEYRKIGEADWVTTNNMWHQGTIPKRFNISDTHEFKPFEPPKEPENPF